MEFYARETILNEMNQSLPNMLSKYDLEDIGIFEEEGEGNSYYLGYTVRKNGDVNMIHQKFRKNAAGHLAPAERQVWVIESDDGDFRIYKSLDDVFQYLDIGKKRA